MHSAGQILLLQMMPSNLGAYHMLTSNPVVMNSYLLVAVKKIAGSTESNSYMFMALAQEYLNSLGIVNENTVRQMTFDLCKWMFGKNHVTTRMVDQDPSAIFLQLGSSMQSQSDRDFRVVRDFNISN